jgi:threonine/homoserine/homoserine lactone efflux protein
MEVSFLLRGVIIGFSIAAPVGPIGVLCIRRSLNYGFRTGFYTGLGAATADAIYGAVSAFGLTAISMLLLKVQFWLRIAGGLFLCYLGMQSLFAKPVTGAGTPMTGKNLSAFSSTLVLTLTNPATILSFVAIFAGAGLTAAAHVSEAAAMVGGVFLGSALWWLFLSFSVVLFRKRFDAKFLRATNILSGVIMLGFGIYFVSPADPSP